MSKKVYVRVDKAIEPGDLVRCVRGDGECKPGDIRKVSRMNERYKTIFYAHGSGRPRWKGCWEPVRKLAVGDWVLVLDEGPYKVTNIAEDLEDFPIYIEDLHDEDCDGYFSTEYLELYQPEKHGQKLEAKDSVYGTGPDQRQLLQLQVAEMIVEMLDQYGSAHMHTQPRIGDTWVSGGKSKHCIAKLSPNDTWDTLTGVYVALCKATGRKIPGWIYGRQANDQ